MAPPAAAAATSTSSTTNDQTSQYINRRSSSAADVTTPMIKKPFEVENKHHQHHHHDHGHDCGGGATTTPTEDDQEPRIPLLHLLAFCLASLTGGMVIGGQKQIMKEYTENLGVSVFFQVGGGGGGSSGGRKGVVGIGISLFLSYTLKPPVSPRCSRLVTLDIFHLPNWETL